MEEHDTRTCDVLVIGSGAAGLRAGIAASNEGLDVLVVGRRALRDAHTVLAAGGINAALGTVDPDDSWQQHFADTLNEAYFLADPRAVELLAREAPDAIDELVRWGCELTRTPDGRIDQRYFGAHTYRRTCYAGDYTGRAVLEAVADRAEQAGIPILEDKVVTSLLVADGVCFGAYTVQPDSGERGVLHARATVLAAGGHTRLWRRSTSRAGENTGDGIALGLRAGCRVADAELVQFHPTGMVAPADMEGMLVTEAVRGEGGRLFNTRGERFMNRYDPDRLELSTRDIVARAIYTEIREGRGTEAEGVRLDVSHLDGEAIDRKLPRMRRQLLDAQGLDIAEEPVEVAPTAHYSMGGVVVDPETHATDVERLFAAGECTAGLHGANRLGGNSLAETIVFGRRAGRGAARAAADGATRLDRAAVAAAAHELASAAGSGSAHPDELLAELQDLMWRHAGVVRDEEGLTEGLAQLRALRAAAAEGHEAAEEPRAAVTAHDLRSALFAAEATLLAARERRESRGAHCRRDHPDTDDAWRVNLLVRLEGDELTLGRRAVPDVPDHLREWVRASADLDTADRLLE